MIFYYDETTLAAVRYGPYKFIFSAKLDGNWDDPLVDFGRPSVVNLRMDPFERNMNNGRVD